MQAANRTLRTLAHLPLHFPDKGITLLVLEGTGNDKYEVDNGPYPASSEGEQLNYPDCRMAGVKTVNTEAPYKDAQKKGREPVSPFTSPLHQRDSAPGARRGAGRATLPAVDAEILSVPGRDSA